MAGTNDAQGKIVLKTVVALVVVLLVTGAPPTEASNFVFFSSSGCSGNVAVLDSCGCSTVPTNTHGAYQFSFTGQTAVAYNGPQCTGVAGARFADNAAQCSPIGWLSIFIQC